MRIDQRRSLRIAGATTLHYAVIIAALLGGPRLHAQDPDGEPPAATDGARDPAVPVDGDRDATPGSVGDDSSSDDLGMSDLEDIQLFELDIPVVVTAARHAQTLMNVPYAMSVITADDIRRAGARTVADALRLAPGMDVAEIAANISAVSPRGNHGFLSRMTLVLVDGRQLFDSFFGGAVWGSWPFQVEDIERIEVIRGPGGVTWGANAVNGVINIITKDPRDQVGLTSVSVGGNRGSHRQYLGYGYADERLRLRVSGDYEGHDGFTRGGSLLRGLDDEFQAGTLRVHAIFEPREFDTYTFSAGSKVLANGFPSTPMALFNAHQAESQASYLLGRWHREVTPDNAFDITAYVNDFHVAPGFDSGDYRYQQFALQYSHTLRLSERHTLTWGVDTRWDYVDATNADPQMLSRDVINSGIVGLYLQDEWRITPRWTLNLGGRIDYDSFGGFQPSARASLAYNLTDNSTVYGAVSRGFQMAPAALRYMEVPLAAGLACVTADRNLDAIQLLAYEAGYRARLFDRFDFSANLFWHEYNDHTVLHPRIGPPGLIRLHDRNGADASRYGIELDARWRATDRLTLLGHYTYQGFDWRSGPAFHLTDAMTTPRHKAMVGARYDLTDDLHLASHLYFTDEVRAPDSLIPFRSHRIDTYFRLDLLAEYEFWDGRAAFSIGVRNLIERHHAEGGSLFLNNADVPRTFYAQLRIRIK